jgi:hypothetical protein
MPFGRRCLVNLVLLSECGLEVGETPAVPVATGCLSTKVGLFDRLAENLLDEGRENSIASKRNGEYARDI